METKYKSLKVAITHEEYKKLQELAFENDKKISGYVRHLILITNALDKKTKHITPKTYTPADPLLLRELNQIGNNLNQIAKYCNLKRELDSNVLENLELIEQYIQTSIKKEGWNDNYI